MDQKLREEQAGFCSGRSCIEQIFILCTIIEQSLEYQQHLSITFVDFTKPFDSVHRDSLWNIARSYGIPEQFVKIFQTLYLQSSCCVHTEDGYTDFFTIETGVGKGVSSLPSSSFLSLTLLCGVPLTKMALGYLGIHQHA